MKKRKHFNNSIKCVIDNEWELRPIESKPELIFIVIVSLYFYIKQVCI